MNPVLKINNSSIDSHLFASNLRFVCKAIVKHPDNTKNLFLVIQRSESDFRRASTWDIPGGAINFGELHQNGVAREVQEEVGIQIANISEIIVMTGYSNNQYTIIVGALCDGLSEKVTLSDEHQAFEWISPENYFLKYAKNYTYLQHRSLNINSTNFIHDIIYTAYNL